MNTQSEPGTQTLLPSTDLRASHAPRTLDTPRDFAPFKTLAEWEARRTYIRQQALVSCGLYPLPPRTPLQSHIFDRVERDGYTIEKVYFQTYPGFYLAGNLYRPHGSSRHGSYPGILVAHGHWTEGRMANNPLGSIPARAITFARQGAVAFTYDMVGYNDTRQVDHRFANDRQHWLWGISLMGLQTWNSIRALDFLASLPDVDRHRLAITGESGGGTQTMLLGAVDDRLAAVAPCVMVSHSMQGGCICENSPGLRIDFSNMEVAAVAAPRPQIMVGATGDWTKTMMTVEGPAVRSIYKLYGKEDHLQHVIFNYPHNINKESREAVDRFFAKWLIHDPYADQFQEPPFQVEPVENLRVFPDDKPLPPDAKDAAALTAYLVQLGKDQVEAHKPHNRHSLQQFHATFLPAWLHTMAAELPRSENLLSSAGGPASVKGGTLLRLHLGRAGREDNIPVALFLPTATSALSHGPRPPSISLSHAGKIPSAAKLPAVVIAGPNGRGELMDIGSGKPGPLAEEFLSRGCAVLLLDTFLTGERADPAAEAQRQPFEKFFTTYNRTDLQERVQDLLTACAYLRSRNDIGRVSLMGQGKAGLWALLAAPAADAVAADCVQLDLTTDDALSSDELFVPCLRRLGDFRTTAILAAPHPLLLHNTGSRFSAAPWIGEVYHSIGASSSLRVESGPLQDTVVADWLIPPSPSS